MSQEKKQWSAIIIMIALFAMIAFVTNLCSPMAVIVKNDFGASNVLAQIGNYGNFIAYLFMGIPSGMLISKYGYKKTALIGLAIGIAGILIQWASGQVGKESAFLVYLIGALTSGFTMCILNAVVNPMINLLGGGGNKGNQLIQIGGVFNSSAAVAVYIIMGALIGDATKAHIADVTPALMIALGIFIAAFVILCFSHIQEPKQAPVNTSLITEVVKYRHFVLGVLAIFFYMSIEMGTPGYIMLYLTTACGMDASVVGLLVAVFFLLMLIGRFLGGVLGGVVSTRQMMTTVALLSVVLLAFGILAPADVTVSVPGIDWANLKVIFAEVPVGIFAFLLVGLCASVMWGGIFNLATEGLGKYTAIASGIFMTMVFGCAVMMAIQGAVADATGNYITSYFVPLGCAVYILYYSLFGSKIVNELPKE